MYTTIPLRPAPCFKQLLGTISDTSTLTMRNQPHITPLKPFVCLVSLLLFVCLQVDGLAEEIQPWSENPWYWSYHGQPVLLLGGSDDDNLFQWPSEQLIPQLDRIAGAGGNVVRNTMSDRKDGGWEIYPFAKRDDGKYDLQQWNTEYWDRFEFFLKQTRAREIFVQIEIWDRFDYSDSGGSQRWQIHPYNPLNNITYTAEETGLNASYPDHPGANKQPFFFSTPTQRNIRPLLKVQEAFVNKLLDISLQYDHVLYCIDNETQAEPAWSRHWVELIRRRAGESGRQVCITEMWDDWDLKAARHRQTFDHPEMYNYVDVSQNNHNKGRTHWDNLAYVREYLSDRPRPMNATKTYGADGNKFGHTDQDAIERFWRLLLGGVASIRFHRPDSGLGINHKAVACLKAARRLTASVPLWNLTPATHRLADCGPNECYAATTDNDSTVVLYFPASRETREVRWLPRETKSNLDSSGTTDQAEQWSLFWVDIDHGHALPLQVIDGDTVRPPSELGNVAAVMTRRDRPMLTGELLELDGHSAFMFLPDESKRSDPQPWVMYAPTLQSAYPDEHERWMHERFIDAGIAVGGIDVGEAFGSPSCLQALDSLYQHLTKQRGFSTRPVVLGRSRGGLWVCQWAAKNPERVAGLAGIYPVFDLTNYPGLETAAKAYEITTAELQETLGQRNPIAQVERLVEAGVPAYLVHGALDQIVPLETNSDAFLRRYQAAGRGNLVTLETIADQGHNYWPGFFRSRGLVDFVIRSAR